MQRVLCKKAMKRLIGVITKVFLVTINVIKNGLAVTLKMKKKFNVEKASTFSINDGSKNDQKDVICKLFLNFLRKRKMSL